MAPVIQMLDVKLVIIIVILFRIQTPIEMLSALNFIVFVLGNEIDHLVFEDGKGDGVFFMGVKKMPSYQLLSHGIVEEDFHLAFS